jgi:hypothetical protein
MLNITMIVSSEVLVGHQGLLGDGAIVVGYEASTCDRYTVVHNRMLAHVKMLNSIELGGDFSTDIVARKRIDQNVIVANFARTRH